MSSDVGEIVAVRGPKLKVHEHAEMVAIYNDLRKKGYNHKESVQSCADAFHRSWSGVAYIIRRYQPTTDLAQKILLAGAAKLAMRVVRKADVGQAIDVLSRRNVGVLAPKQEEGSGQQGFFLSVSADSCGAVKVGVALGAMPEAEPVALEGISDRPTLDSVTVTVPEEPHEKDDHEFQGRIGKAASRPESEWSARTRSALNAARNRIKAARVQRGRLASPGVVRPQLVSLQDFDGHAEE